MKTILKGGLFLLLLSVLFWTCTKSTVSPPPGDTKTLGTMAIPRTVQLTFWSQSAVLSGGSISVYIDGAYAGLISGPYSTAPYCGAPNTCTKDLIAGAHTWYAKSAAYVWGTATTQKTITVSADCMTMQLY
ncbi:MAG: hypothetical protein PSX36_08745 [bacterium]|nr:hypothetical protein [bacterium]